MYHPRAGAAREHLRGAKFDVAAMTAAIPQMRDLFRAHGQWIETQRADGRNWIGGDNAGLCDVNAYMTPRWWPRPSIRLLTQAPQDEGKSRL